MRKQLSALLMLSFAVMMVSAQAPPVVTVLQGFDPVELVSGREVKGAVDLAVVRGRFHYLFSSRENLDRFSSSPEEYQIQMGGGCGQMGPLSGAGNPDRFYVHDRHIYIFASDSCRNSFKAAPAIHLDIPDPIPMGNEVAQKRANELLQLALTGLGGAPRVDSVASFESRSRIVYKQGDKETVGHRVLTIVFPERYRDEEFWGQSSWASVLSGGKASTIDKNGVWVRENAVSVALERELYRHPLAILKARRLPGFVALATGKGTVGEFSVELLAVSFKNATTTLGIDGKTGRILQISYRGRRGAYGEVVKSFSDFRSVDGVILPFGVTESFNGKLIVQPTIVYESLGVNGKIDESLFRAQSQSDNQTKPPVFDLDRYQFGMLVRGPKWTPESTSETQKIQAGHMEHIGKMASTGKLIAAGPMLDSGDLRGIFLFRTDSLEEATRLAAEDPAIKAGRLTLELVTWMAPKGIGAKFMEEYRKDTANTKSTMTRYHLALLRGKPGGSVQSAFSQQVQLDHLRNIRAMLDSGRLAAAGPFAGHAELRGVFVLATVSMEEAKAWAESDPAVKAGLVTVEIHPWLVAKEVWPTGTVR